jgi:acylphosphatase
MLRCRLHAFGRVQGVSYRFFVMQCARKFSISGYVRNLEDESVEIVAEAKDAAAMEAFKAAITLKAEGEMGPSVSELRVEVEENIEKASYEGFEIAD